MSSADKKEGYDAYVFSAHEELNYVVGSGEGYYCD